MVADAFSGLEGASTKSNAEPWLPPTPSHWRVVQLGFVNGTVAGYAFPSDGFSADGDHVRLLRGMNVKPERIDWTDTVYWDAEAAPVPSEFVLEVGDLVFGMDRPFVGGGVRIAAISDNDLPALLLQRVMRIRPHDEAGRGYMRYVMSTDAFFNYLEPLFTGVSVPHVSEWQVRKFKMPFPPLNEQKSIADYLDRETARIDILIEEQQALVGMLRERRVATVAEALDGYETVRLRRLVDPARPMTYGILQCGEPVDGGVAYIGPSDIAGEGVSPERDALRTTSPEIASTYRRSVLAGGDVVVSIGPAYGKVAVVSDDLTGANLTQDTVRVALRPDLVDTRFVVWALLSRQTSEYWDYQIMGATFRRLNLGTLARTPIPLPPIDVQRHIARYLDAQTARIDTLITETERFIELSKERRAALITAAVTGQIDVREAA